ncbi:MAG: hypothetical protein C0405_09600 [Desulfovibrio sp.]|nr:hypothetical protein [Desulfovibrio sp.]
MAPAIGAAIGGPFGALAGAAVNAVFGLGEDATEQAQAEALKKATPEQLLDLKEADSKFKLDMERLGVDLARIDAADRASARQRETTLRDWVPAVLAVSVTVGFFGLLGWLMKESPPAGSKDILNIMLGALGAAWGSIVAYYFGSSAGSAKMRETLQTVVTSGK